MHESDFRPKKKSKRKKEKSFSVAVLLHPPQLSRVDMSGSEEAAAAVVPAPEGPVTAPGEPTATATPAEPPVAEGGEVAPPAAAAAAAAAREGETAEESKTDGPEVAAAAEQAAAESRGSATGSPDEFPANMPLEDRIRREPAQKVK